MKRIYFLFFLFHFFGFAKAQISLDSISNQVELGGMYFNTTPDSFYHWTSLAEKELKKIKINEENWNQWKVVKGDIKNNLGVYYWREGDLNKALEYLDTAVYYRKQIVDDNKLITTYNNIALVYNDLGEVFLAEEMYRLALDKIDSKATSASEARIYNNLGLLFYFQNMLEKSKDYFIKAIEIEGDSLTIDLAVYKNNLGSYFLKKKKLDSAYSLFQDAYKIYDRLDNDLGKAHELNQYGRYFFLGGNFSEAEKFYLKALKIYSDYEKISGQIVSHNGLSKVYYELKNYQKSKYHIEIALDLIDHYSVKSTLVKVYATSYELYKAMNDEKKALHYYEKYIGLNDSISNEEFVRQNNYKESVLRFKIEKDSLNQEYEKERLIRDHNQQVERQIFFFSIVFVLIVLVFLIVSVRGYKERQKLTHENYLKEQLLNKQLESNLNEKSALLIKESLKNMKSQKVIDEIDSIIKESEEKNAEEVNANMKIIRSEIVENRLTRKKLEEHQIFLEKENEVFSLNLKKKYPKLTPGDLKLCVLLRNNYSSDEICLTLSISKNTFSSSKYRIRRRMGLEKGVRLQDFLLEL